MKNSTIKFKLIILTALLVSCESFVEIGPPKTESVSTTVYADDVGAVASVRGVYHELVRIGFASGQQVSVTLLSGASSDEFISYNASMDEFVNNSIAPASSNNGNIWSSAYKTIYYCNTGIEGLMNSTGVSAALKNQLIAELKFLRAFSYYYLVNLYGDVPLILSSDYMINASASRSTKDEVTGQILQDLSEAQAGLPSDFQFANSERARATSWAAAALQARVQLYQNDWAKTEALSSSVIDNVALFKIITDPNAVFLKNSNEAIFQLMPVVASQNTNEGLAFTPPSATTAPTFVALSANFIGAFEPTDKRKTNWTATQTVSGTAITYPFKYKIGKVGLPVTEYSMVLRLAEQYLIRAEARVRLGKFNEAMADINVIRTRAGLPNIQTKIGTPTTDNLITAVEQEKRIELFSEWGHRWFDLKRWNRATTVLQPLKPQWTAADEFYPIPQSELANDPNLGPQNPGY